MKRKGLAGGEDVKCPRQSSGAVREPSPVLAADQSAAQLPLDLEAEWDQRILQGWKRMDEDPEYRAFVEKRLS